jgi:hypothetical protein
MEDLMPGCEVSMLHGHDSETGIQCEQMWKAGERLGRVISWEKSGNFGGCKELKNVIG